MTGFSRDARRCALQALYQFDAGNEGDADLVRGSLEGSRTSDAAQAEGFELARGAWEHRLEADELVKPLTPEWPMRRQPVIDRNLLRLAWYEMKIAGTPPKVVISESVDLARDYSTDQSPSFINGVLDQLFNNQSTSAANEE